MHVFPALSNSYLVLNGIVESYRNHAPFEPVREMVIIGWILTYMLQLDYVYMIGHTPTDEDPAVGTRRCTSCCITKHERRCRVTLPPVRSPRPKSTSLSRYIFFSLYGNSSMCVLLLPASRVVIDRSIRSSSFIFCRSSRLVLLSSYSSTCTWNFLPIEPRKRTPAWL